MKYSTLGLLSLTLSPSVAFSPVHRFGVRKIFSSPLSSLSLPFQDAIPASGLEFNLEENEDKDSMNTAVWIKPGGEVKFGDTTGPPPDESVGKLEVRGDG